MKITYLSGTETAKLVRAALKRAFPGVKFRVRQSGGSAINVNWTDGPAAAPVEAIAGAFAGAGFDGSIDLRTSHTSWLLPDGSACVASDPGTVGSMGRHPAERNWMPDPEAKLVHFGVDFIFCNRETSPALLRRVYDRLAAKGYPVEVVDILTTSDGHAYARCNTYDRDAARGFDMEREIHMAAQRTHCVVAA